MLDTRGTLRRRMNLETLTVPSATLENSVYNLGQLTLTYFTLYRVFWSINGPNGNNNLKRVSPLGTILYQV
jgi:hypothetical protein